MIPSDLQRRIAVRLDPGVRASGGSSRSAGLRRLGFGWLRHDTLRLVQRTGHFTTELLPVLWICSLLLPRVAAR